MLTVVCKGFGEEPVVCGGTTVVIIGVDWPGTVIGVNRVVAEGIPEEPVVNFCSNEGIHAWILKVTMLESTDGSEVIVINNFLTGLLVKSIIWFIVGFDGTSFVNWSTFPLFVVIKLPFTSTKLTAMFNTWLLILGTEMLVISVIW